ncbi:MAG: 26S protease regulatory subunit [Thermoleophilia bacterium]
MSRPDDIDALIAAAGRAPGDVEARRRLAAALLRAGRADEAEEHVAAALRLAPGDPALVTAMADLLRDRPSDALAALTPVPDAPPGDDAPPARPRVTLEDVAGMEQAKREFRLRIVAPFTHPELHAAYGGATGGGVLLYGPPGCGKTLLARAAAGEAGADFMSVGIEEILDMWLGASERNLHDVFVEARRRAPVVLFFDEVDALGPRRGDVRASGGRSVVNQFLAEMDGVGSANEGVLVLAASNAPWHLDGAFRRPGRFDRILFVPPPDLDARVRIIELALASRPSAVRDVPALAGDTDGLSGADLVAIVDRAAQERFAAALETGDMEPITDADLAAARATVTSSVDEWFTTARNWARYANDGGQWDDVLRHLGEGR